MAQSKISLTHAMKVHTPTHITMTLKKYIYIHTLNIKDETHLAGREGGCGSRGYARGVLLPWWGAPGKGRRPGWLEDEAVVLLGAAVGEGGSPAECCAAAATAGAKGSQRRGRPALGRPGLLVADVRAWKGSAGARRDACQGELAHVGCRATVRKEGGRLDCTGVAGKKKAAKEGAQALVKAWLGRPGSTIQQEGRGQGMGVDLLHREEKVRQDMVTAGFGNWRGFVYC